MGWLAPFGMRLGGSRGGMRGYNLPKFEADRDQPAHQSRGPKGGSSVKLYIYIYIYIKAPVLNGPGGWAKPK